MAYSVGAAAAGAVADLVSSGVEDCVDGSLRDKVGGDLRVGEDGFEVADEIGGADDVFAELAKELDGAGVDHGDVHDGVAGGVLHGDAGGAGEEGFELATRAPARRSRRILCRGGYRGLPDSMRWTSLRGSPVAGMK